MVSPEVATFSLVDKQGKSALDFPQNLAALRKHHGLTQQALARGVGVHVVQLRRYESGTSQPSLDVIRKLATALSVSADLLLFGKDERGPDDDIRLQLVAAGASRRSGSMGEHHVR
jgi:transcriptional regulator with XRE-family HTH domain